MRTARRVRRMVSPAAGCRWSPAVSSASTTFRECSMFVIDQPMIRRENRSFVDARYSRALVGPHVADVGGRTSITRRELRVAERRRRAESQPLAR